MDSMGSVVVDRPISWWLIRLWSTEIVSFFSRIWTWLKISSTTWRILENPNLRPKNLLDVPAERRTSKSRSNRVSGDDDPLGKYSELSGANRKTARDQATVIQNRWQSDRCKWKNQQVVGTLLAPPLAIDWSPVAIDRQPSDNDFSVHFSHRYIFHKPLKRFLDSSFIEPRRLIATK